MMIDLPSKFLEDLRMKPETGMGYQIVSIILNDGRRFDRVVIVEGRVTQVKGMDGIPFSPGDIREIILTHER